MPPTYRVALAGLGTAGLGDVIVPDVFSSVGYPEEEETPLKLTRALNGPGGIELALPSFGSTDMTKENFATGERELHVYKTDEGGERLVGGHRLWKRKPEGRGLVRFIGQGFYSSLRKREISDKKLYLPTDPATGTPRVSSDQVNIAWDLIAYTQGKAGGGLGITRVGTDASNASGVRRHAAYCSWELRKVADVIEELAGALNGFDFEVGPDKVWRTWYPRRGSVRPVTLDAAINVSDLGFEEDAFEDTVSTFRAIGPCEQCDGNSMIKMSSDAGALAKFGLLEDSEHWAVKDDDHLQALADEQLRIRGAALSQPEVVVSSDLGAPVWGVDYDVGDVVTVQASDDFNTFSGQFRVLSIAVGVGPGGSEDVAVGLDQAIA